MSIYLLYLYIDYKNGLNLRLNFLYLKLISNINLLLTFDQTISNFKNL